MLLGTFLYMFFLVYTFLWDMYQGMELLGHRVYLCSALERLLNSYAMCLYQFILLTNSGESLGMSGEVTVFSPTIDNADKFIFAILVNVF